MSLFKKEGFIEASTHILIGLFYFSKREY